MGYINFYKQIQDLSLLKLPELDFEFIYTIMKYWTVYHYSKYLFSIFHMKFQYHFNLLFNISVIFLAYISNIQTIFLEKHRLPICLQTSIIHTFYFEYLLNVFFLNYMQFNKFYDIKWMKNYYSISFLIDLIGCAALPELYDSKKFCIKGY